MKVLFKDVFSFSKKHRHQSAEPQALSNVSTTGQVAFALTKSFETSSGRSVKPVTGSSQVHRAQQAETHRTSIPWDIPSGKHAMWMHVNACHIMSFTASMITTGLEPRPRHSQNVSCRLAPAQSSRWWKSGESAGRLCSLGSICHHFSIINNLPQKSTEDTGYFSISSLCIAEGGRKRMKMDQSVSVLRLQSPFSSDNSTGCILAWPASGFLGKVELEECQAISGW